MVFTAVMKFIFQYNVKRPRQANVSCVIFHKTHQQTHSVQLCQSVNAVNSSELVFTVFFFRFVYIYLFLFVLCGLVEGLLPPTDNSIAVNNNNSNDVEIQRMWNVKCTIIPVIIEATGIVTKSLRKSLEAKPGKSSIDLLQKTAMVEHHT
jgi:hypothetical protein